MKTILFCLIAAFPAFGIYKIGDTPKNVCWNVAELAAPAKVCLNDATKLGEVQVLLFNAGWCVPCQQEFKELVPAMEAFAGKRIHFISLSCEGWNHGDSPARLFLEQWHLWHKIDKAKAQWYTAASPRNAGNDYFNGPSVPNVVILNAAGKVAYKAINPGVREIARQINKILK